MKIKFLGAAGTVTGSKFQLEHKGLYFLVDCGLYQGPREQRELNHRPLERAAEYRAVLLTHAHIDHSGYLPALVRGGFHRKIHCSAPTRELCKILLMDAARLQEEDAEYANRTRHSRHFPAEPLYTVPDAAAALELFESHEYGSWFDLGESVAARFVRNGHILGSACVQVRWSDDNVARTLTFTGDLGNGRSQVIKGPEVLTATDYLVSESTYGDRKIKSLDEDEFAALINRVYKRQGTLVIPAFSVGRTQEILYIIKKLQQREKVPTEIPVYLDSPMATRASEVYTRFPAELRLPDGGMLAEKFFHPVNYRICESPDESMLLCMSSAPKIVLSASGMLQGGRVLHHLKAKLPDPKNAVLFTGYQGQGTKGLLLKGGIGQIRIHHQLVEVAAEIVTLDALSAHADSDELMAWYRNFPKPPAGVFLVHGETASLGALSYRIRNELGWPCTVAELNAEFKLG